jgi:hypothetical protein
MNSQQRRAERARRNRPPRRRVPWVAGLAVLVVVGALIGAIVARSSSGSKTSGDASGSLLASVTGVPASVSTAVGAGSATGPKPIDAPALTKDGKPLIVYLGAEYCPYCAAERWAMIVALSRFGTFSGLQTTHSSSTDVYPSTPTFSFHGASFDSQYVAFEGVELAGNELSGGNYPKLDTPTAEQQQLLDTYDAPPYVAANAAGAIPFIDIGGKYIVSGATYDPGVLAGKTHEQIAAALSDPTSAVAKGVIGAANQITAAICSVTGNQPAATCSNPTIAAIQATLG